MATKTKATPAKLKAKARAAVAETIIPVRVPEGAAQAMGVEEIAEALKISVATLRRMIATGEYPAPDKRIRSRLLWNMATHNAWFAALGGEGKGGA